MKKFILMLLFPTLFFLSCEKIDKDAPDCIRHKVREFAKNPICNSGSSVSEYVFKGSNVYVFSEGSCGADLGAAVYNESCEYLGYLGGFTGNMIIEGVIFNQEAVFIKRILEN